MEKASSRLRVLALLVALMFIALSTRLWFLQVLATQRFDKEARDNSVRFEYTDPLRGQMYDAQGRKLVVNQESLEVRITPDQLGDKGEAVVGRVAELANVPIRDIVAKLQDKRFLPSQAIPVAEFVPKEVGFFIAEHPSQFPGVEVVKTAVRSYPFGRLAAHVLGWTGLIDATQYVDLQKQGYGPNDIVGKFGLESVYEPYLRGERGKQKLIVNADGETIQALGTIAPTPGDDLQLSLDARVQRLAEKALAEGMARAHAYHDQNGRTLQANAGTVVVLDANTGGVVAMASNPGFDPSWYVHGLTPQQNKYLSKNANAPSVSRATQLTYQPGSTFKPITGLAAIKEGFASLSGSYPCDATYTKSGDTSGTVFHNWTTANLGYMSIGRALIVSCDTVFDAFGGDFYDQYAQNSIGSHADLLERDLHDWGFESQTGIDLTSEANGFVPDPAWAAEPAQSCPTCAFPYGWVPGGDIQTMIGSGYVLVSPLQLAQAYGAIANGGHLCRPHLVDQIVAPDGSIAKRIDSHCDQTVPYTPQELTYIREALRGVVSSGTAQCAFAGFPTSQVAVAGKTGTAERPPHQDTSWFASMVGPDPDHPQYVIVTMVEQGGFGGQTAAPITRQVIDALYPNLNDASQPSCVTPDR
ncbi:MAG: penicillin-binding protein 2 [Actinomycetota bacterium]